MASSSFGVVLPGRPVLTDFRCATSDPIRPIERPRPIVQSLPPQIHTSQNDTRPVDASGSKYVTEVPMPAAITDLTFFLLPGVQLPTGAGVALYYAMPPFQEWAVLGALTAEKPRWVRRYGCVGVGGADPIQLRLMETRSLPSSYRCPPDGLSQ